MSRSARQAPLSIAMVGTRGVPAHYGGFETCVEQVGQRLAERGHRVVVYCRTAAELEAPGPAEHLGMTLVHRPAMRKRSLETLSHTALSTAHLLRHRTDVALVFNAANAPFLPMIRAARIPVATHVDGLEWQRAKWGGLGQRYYRIVERLAVKWSDALIADAQGIADYYRRRFDADTDSISYGAPDLTGVGTELLTEIGLRRDAFHLAVARFEPENHILEIIQGYCRSAATLPLVVVGSAPYSNEYTQRVHAAVDNRVRLLGGVWNADLLDQLYAGARTYLHGHSVGGTNPSLLRALGGGTATLAYDVTFNREVAAEAAGYWANARELALQIELAEADRTLQARRQCAARQRARSYDWEDVTDRYESLCRRLSESTHKGRSQRGHTIVKTSELHTLAVRESQ